MIESSTSRKVSDFLINKNLTGSLKIWASEGALSFHTVKHHNSYKSMDCTPALIRQMCDDSDIAKKLSCARTKTEAIIDQVLSPHSINVVISALSNVPYLSICTDGSNHGSTKMFPVLIQYFEASNGIQVKLLDLKNTPNEKSETISELLIQTLNKYKLGDKCIAFVGDNTNTNFGGINRKEGCNIFTNLKNNLNKELVGIGCPAHILHNSIHHGVDQLDNIDIDSIVLKIFNYFSIYTVRTEKLKEFCDFVNINYRNLLYHSKTRWLSLFPAINRILQMYPSLKSFFLSEKQPPKAIKSFFENDFSEIYLWFIHSLMYIFHKKMELIEAEKNSIIEVTYILDTIMNILQERYDAKFIPLKVKELLTILRNNGQDTACEKFLENVLRVYASSLEYLKKWTHTLSDFKVNILVFY